MKLNNLKYKLAMKSIIAFSSFIFLSFITPDLKNEVCPMSEGKVRSDIRNFVHGEGKGKKLSIEGKAGSKIFAVTEGVVSIIGEKTHSVFITNGKMKYIYTGFESNLTIGQKVVRGEEIGSLKEDGIFLLEVRKDNECVNVDDYIKCSL